VLRSDEAGWEEWKTEAELLKLSEKYPTRYQKNISGTWQCPPGEAHARKLGLKYRVRSDAELEPIKIQNLMFLEDYVKFTSLVSPEVLAVVLKRVKQQPGITIAELLAIAEGVRANDLYGIIASEKLYVDLAASPLDIELRSSSTGRLLGRPWLTLLIDAYSRRILALYLTFDAPSYRSCMMALRICVQRCARFPQAIVVDGGKEFHSIYFD
jgi:hypothetical protein